MIACHVWFLVTNFHGFQKETKLHKSQWPIIPPPKSISLEKVHTLWESKHISFISSTPKTFVPLVHHFLAAILGFPIKLATWLYIFSGHQAFAPFNGLTSQRLEMTHIFRACWYSWSMFWISWCGAQKNRMCFKCFDCHHVYIEKEYVRYSIPWYLQNRPAWSVSMVPM